MSGMKYDYTGKNIFVGIDVHKKTYSVSVMHDNVLVKRDTIPAYPERLVQSLKKYFSGANIKSAYEAGFSGFGLHRHLNENNEEASELLRDVGFIYTMMMNGIESYNASSNMELHLIALGKSITGDVSESCSVLTHLALKEFQEILNSH